jgi:hypothetical protein
VPDREVGAVTESILWGGGILRSCRDPGGRRRNRLDADDGQTTSRHAWKRRCHVSTIDPTWTLDTARIPFIGGLSLPWGQLPVEQSAKKGVSISL